MIAGACSDTEQAPFIVPLIRHHPIYICEMGVS